MSLVYSLIKATRDKFFIYVRYNSPSHCKRNTIDFLPVSELNLNSNVDKTLNTKTKTKSYIQDSIMFMMPELVFNTDRISIYFF
jgi:hypothetical protein